MSDIRVDTVYPHRRSHTDEDAATCCFLKFAKRWNPALPIKVCYVEDTTYNFDWRTLETNGHYAVGWGSGSGDEHASPENPDGTKDECCLDKIVKLLGCENDPGLKEIIPYIRAQDLEGKSNPWGLSSVKKAVLEIRGIDDYQAFEWFRPVFEMKYAWAAGGITASTERLVSPRFMECAKQWATQKWGDEKTLWRKDTPGMRQITPYLLTVKGRGTSDPFGIARLGEDLHDAYPDNPEIAQSFIFMALEGMYQQQMSFHRCLVEVIPYAQPAKALCKIYDEAQGRWRRIRLKGVVAQTKEWQFQRAARYQGENGGGADFVIQQDPDTGNVQVFTRRLWPSRRYNRCAVIDLRGVIQQLRHDEMATDGYEPDPGEGDPPDLDILSGGEYWDALAMERRFVRWFWFQGSQNPESPGGQCAFNGTRSHAVRATLQSLDQVRTTTEKHLTIKFVPMPAEWQQRQARVNGRKKVRRQRTGKK